MEIHFPMNKTNLVSFSYNKIDTLFFRLFDNFWKVIFSFFGHNFLTNEPNLKFDTSKFKWKYPLYDEKKLNIKSIFFGPGN